MKFTNTKKKEEEAKQEYINNAPLSEKKRKTTSVTIAINEKEREMLEPQKTKLAERFQEVHSSEIVPWKTSRKR